MAKRQRTLENQELATLRRAYEILSLENTDLREDNMALRSKVRRLMERIMAGRENKDHYVEQQHWVVQEMHNLTRDLLQEWRDVDAETNLNFAQPNNPPSSS